MKFVRRSAFGWGPTKAPRISTITKGIAVHYNGGNTRLVQKGHKECVAYWKRTRNMHVSGGRGEKWLDIGYSFGVCPHGDVFEGRGVNRQQAAQGPGGNSTYYSVTFMGGPDEGPTEDQLEAFAELRAWLMTNHRVAGTVKGHRDFMNTSCPGPKLYNLVRSGVLKRKPKGKPVDPSPPKPKPRVIVQGMSGPDVRELKDRLIALGYKDVQKGDTYGKHAVAAVMRFQRKKGLEVDGKVGPDTRKALGL